MSISERNSLQRITLHSAEKHFFVAVNPPFSPESPTYDQLDFMATEVRDFDDGSQVFVYKREAFGTTTKQQNGELVGFAHVATKDVGGVVLEATVRPVSR